MKLTGSDFESEVLASDIPVLVEFWASWCPPCKTMEPLMDKLGKEFDGTVKVSKINVDQNRMSANNHDVSGIPTFMTFSKGKEIERRIGALSEGMLKEMIEKALNLDD